MILDACNHAGTLTTKDFYARSTDKNLGRCSLSKKNYEKDIALKELETNLDM